MTDTPREAVEYRANLDGPEDVVTVRVPLAVTRADVGRADWVSVREALLDGLRETYGALLDQVIAERGWR